MPNIEHKIAAMNALAEILATDDEDSYIVSTAAKTYEALRANVERRAAICDCDLKIAGQVQLRVDCPKHWDATSAEYVEKALARGEDPYYWVSPDDGRAYTGYMAVRKRMAYGELLNAE